jgi:transcriptional regulator with XRE-family HTH domain
VKKSLVVNFTLCDIWVMADVHPLRAWRASHGKTLVQVAGVVGVTPSHLSEIERYENTPSLALAAKLSRETEIPLAQFVRDTLGESVS